MLDQVAEKPLLPSLPNEPQIDHILLEVYKWFIGSGRVIWITGKIKQAYRNEVTKGSAFYNIEVVLASKQMFNKEYRKVAELYRGRGLSLEIHYFGDSAEVGDVHPLCSKTGGQFYLYDGFECERWRSLM